MIIAKTTIGVLHISENINTPLRGDYNHQKDEKWIMFRTKYRLKATDDLFKWFDLYLRLCAEGLL
jgi:hypothetical protein